MENGVGMAIAFEDQIKELHWLLAQALDTHLGNSCLCRCLDTMFLLLAKAGTWFWSNVSWLFRGVTTYIMRVNLS